MSMSLGWGLPSPSLLGARPGPSRLGEADPTSRGCCSGCKPEDGPGNGSWENCPIALESRGLGRRLGPTTAWRSHAYAIGLNGPGLGNSCVLRWPGALHPLSSAIQPDNTQARIALATPRRALLGARADPEHDVT